MLWREKQRNNSPIDRLPSLTFAIFTTGTPLLVQVGALEREPRSYGRNITYRNKIDFTIHRRHLPHELGN